ncbi:MAG: Ig-like domain-containing protein [Anaerolineales bacterium]|nr:Ig-like domain-containing protein [Anaerolineales bacterium]
MKKLSTTILNSRHVNHSIYRLCLVILVGVMLVSACRPAPVVPPVTVRPVLTSTPTAIPPSPTAAFQAIDDGSPLPPQVVERQPDRGQPLSTKGEIQITFDQPMDIEKSSTAWTMIDSSGKEVEGKITWPSTRTLRFQPARSLQSGSQYQAELGLQTASAKGVTLEEPLLFEFNTVSELQVSQVFPADGAIDIANNAVITVIFNRPVVPLVIAEEKDKLPAPLSISPALSGSGEWVNTSVFAFRADEPLKGNTTYNVTVKAGLEDAGQESELTQDYAWSFTTITASIESFELSNGWVNPENNFRNVLLDEYFRLRFFQPMDPISTEAAFSLTSTSGEKVNWLTSWNTSFTQVVITPTQRLALGTSYILNLDASAQAADGGGLRNGLTWNFTTVPPPAIKTIIPTNNSTQDTYSGQLRIQFASPMNIASVKQRVLITPAPAGEVQWWYNEWNWSMIAYVLQPSTSYEIRLLPGMQDIYGNQITQGQTVRFQTGPYAPSAGLQMPYEPAIFRLGGPQEFYITYRNIKTLDARLYRLSVNEFIHFLNGKLQVNEFYPQEDNLIWQAQETSVGELDEIILKKYTPQTAEGRQLLPGFYFLALDSPEVFHYGPYLDHRLLVVATANLTFKTTTTDALVWLTDLNTGEPIENIPVTIYDDFVKTIKVGTTDQDGMVYLDLPAPEDPYDNRFALASTEDMKNLAFASSQWGSGVSTWDYGIWGSYYSPANQPRAYVYTERPIYRPGQPVYFKGILRLDDDLDYQIPDTAKAHIKISNYQETIYEEDLPLSDYGSFEGQILLDSEAALGYYSIEVQIPAQEAIIGAVGFTVAEYRRPEFQVTVNAEPEDVLAGDSFTAAIQADYYSGGGVANAEVYWMLTSDPFTFTPPDELSAYSFTADDMDMGFYQEYDSGSVLLAEGTGATNAQGRLSLTLPANLGEAKTGRRLTLEATVTDISQNSVSGRAAITAHRSQVYPGVRPQTYLGEAGKEQAFEIVAVDWNGVLLPGQKVTVEIVERRWYSVQEQDAEGRISWTTTVEDILVNIFPEVILDDKGQATVRFTPPNGGIFRAYVTALDALGNPGKASAYLWVASEDYIPWRQTNDRSFDLVSDRKSYTPGDTAEILIASPFQGEAYALVTVERGRVHYQDVILLDSNSTIYKLPITANMAPNIYVSVVVVKGVDDTNPRPNFKMGILELMVDTSQQNLNVLLTSDRTQAGPGEKVTFTVKTTAADGQPVSAEVSLSLSDLATLSLLPPNSSPILDYFYSERTLGVWTSVPIAMNIEEYNADVSEKMVEGGRGGSGGGAKGEGIMGVVEVRQDFPDTAFWDGQVVTNQDGIASVTVSLPDNLTTWRMDARAVTQDTRVGQTVFDLVSTKSLLVRPQTPRFFVANDQVVLGMAVQNNTDQTLQISANLQTEGVELKQAASQAVQINAKSQVYVTWDATVLPEAQRVDLIFSAEGGGYRDASRPPMGTLDQQGIPVYRYEAPETVGTSGQMTEGGSLLEAINLPSTFKVSQGELTVQVSPSLAASMTDGLDYLKHYPYECIEQTISRFLPNVLTTQALKAAGLSNAEIEEDLQEQVSIALQRLYNWQNADGGWGWWRNQKSETLTSAYVVLGLVEAKEAGYTVSQDVISRGLGFLRGRLISAVGLTNPEKLNRQAFLLYVLARAGKPEVSSSVQIYEQRQNMALYARAFLAQTFYWIDEADPRLQTLLSDFASTAFLSASGTHWEEKVTDRWNWNTDTRTTAIVLSALSQIDPGNPLNANAVRWLMSSRTNGYWRGTQETAWTLMGLTRWMVASGELEANYQFAVSLNGKQLGSGIANSETLRQTTLLKVDIADLLTDQANRLVFARDDGTGNLYYTAHLKAYLPVEQIKSLDQGIVISRSYYQLDDMENPVTSAGQGDLLLARLTIVVPTAVHYLVVDDPLPAGLEAVDQSLLTSPQTVEVPQTYSWEDVFWRGWGWWYFDHTQYRDEKVMLSASYLPAGTYIFTYLVRASTVGVFRAIPPTASEFYFLEVYGRGEGSLFTVAP